METKKEVCKCPICKRELADDGEKIILDEVVIRFASELYWRTRDLVESGSADLAVTEQIRRNCETIINLCERH